MKITATIITLNEQSHIERCLESLKDLADEVIVVDSGSHDRTLEIAQRYGARTFVRDWTNYSDQKNHAAALASHDWILSLDADEALSPELLLALLDVKQGQPDFSAFEFSRKALYLSRWIEHCGWYPDIKPRLYRRDRAGWQGAWVHESLRIEGRVQRLNGDLLHYTCESISEHLRSIDRYTTLAAQELYSRGTKSGVFRSSFSAASAFFKTYWIRQGFRDGTQGFLIACFASYYNLTKYAKLWELERQNRPTETTERDH